MWSISFSFFMLMFVFYTFLSELNNTEGIYEKQPKDLFLHSVVSVDQNTKIAFVSNKHIIFVLEMCALSYSKGSLDLLLLRPDAINSRLFLWIK